MYIVSIDTKGSKQDLLAAGFNIVGNEIFVDVVGEVYRFRLADLVEIVLVDAGDPVPMVVH